jgi:hypothetical protein
MVRGVIADIAPITMHSSNKARAGWHEKSANNLPNACSTGIFCRAALFQTRIENIANWLAAGNCSTSVL